MENRVFEDDKRLAQRLLAGDAGAFNDFYSSSAQRLAAFVMRRSDLDFSAAEDIVQNAMIKALRSLHGYRGEASLFTWMCEICRNELADHHRKTRRRPGLDSLDSDAKSRATVLQLAAPADLEPNRCLEQADDSASVIRAMRRIPERYARILEWKYGDELPVQEIGRMLGVTTIAAQSLLARAREAFHDAFLLATELQFEAEQSRSGTAHD